MSRFLCANAPAPPLISALVQTRTRGDRIQRVSDPLRPRSVLILRSPALIILPMVFLSYRTRQDVVLPLSEPITGLDGRTLHEIPVPADTTVAVGLLSDRFEPWGIAVGMLALTAAASFIFWGVLSHTFAGLIMFSVLFGIISSGWTTLWTGFVRPIASE